MYPLCPPPPPPGHGECPDAVGAGGGDPVQAGSGAPGGHQEHVVGEITGLPAGRGGLAEDYTGPQPRRLTAGRHENLAQICQSLPEEWTLG